MGAGHEQEGGRREGKKAYKRRWVLPLSMAACAFFAQSLVKEELPPQSMGKKLRPLGMVPPGTDAQL